MSRGRIHLRVTIRASPTAIFGFLTNLERTPEWDPRVTKVTQMTRGALRRGVILRSTLLVDGESVSFDDEITDFEPPTRLGLRSVLGATNAVTYTLSEEDGGETVVDVVLVYELPEPPSEARLDEAGLRQAIANALAASLDRLKNLVEGDGSAP